HHQSSFGDGCSHLAGQYTVWGEVVSGMDAVDSIKAGAGRGGLVASPDRIEKAYIEQAAS
ncbi:MAG: peptidylprolyl isomerase, partial [Pseudomonadota bacterium]